MFSGHTYRDVVVTSVPLAALGTLPILIPDVVAERHVAVDLSLALLGGGALLGDVVLLFGALKNRKFSILNSRSN